MRPLSCDPFPDIRRAVSEFGSIQFTQAQEFHGLAVHEKDLRQIDGHCAPLLFQQRPTALIVKLDLIENLVLLERVLAGGHRTPLRAATELVIYAIAGLSKFNFRVARSNEKWIGGIVGLVTGAVSAATGVQVIPSMPFMQAIGMEKDELVQSLGVFFTVATVALAFNLTSAGLLSVSTALPGAVAMGSAFAGMFIGQAVRSRMQPEAFRRWFLIAMIFLGLYLVGSAVYKMTAS